MGMRVHALASVVIACAASLACAPPRPLSCPDPAADATARPGVGADPALAADIAAMWETKPLSDGHFASTPAAIEAALRVFRSAPLVGRTRGEVCRLLGHNQKGSRSVYNCPWFEVPADVL